MCDLDVNGNAINWRAVPGKYEREFVQQCSADIDWNIARSMQQDYEQARKAAREGKQDKSFYNKAVFATDKNLQLFQSSNMDSMGVSSFGGKISKDITGFFFLNKSTRFITGLLQERILTLLCLACNYVKIYYSIESWTVKFGKRDTFSVTDDITFG